MSTIRYGQLGKQIIVLERFERPHRVSALASFVAGLIAAALLIGGLVR